MKRKAKVYEFGYSIVKKLDISGRYTTGYAIEKNGKHIVEYSYSSGAKMGLARLIEQEKENEKK
jgi:hypothetical protein